MRDAFSSIRSMSSFLRTTDYSLPDDHHIVRHVGSSKIKKGKVEASAFELRPNEAGVSVNWLEYYSGLGKADQLSKIRRSSGLSLKKSGRFAELNVGRVRQRLVDEGFEKISIVHSPLCKNPSHSEIRGLPDANSAFDAEMAGDFIAKCVIECHPAVIEE